MNIMVKSLTPLGLGLIFVFVFVIAMLRLRRGRRKRELGQEEMAMQSTVVVNSPAHQAVLDMIQQLHIDAEQRPPWSRINYYRQVMDELTQGLTFSSHIKPTASDEPAGEWVWADHADPRRRILYIHGGGWSAGSPQSHRAITDQLAQLAQAWVLVVDYRLLPAHSYMAGLRDCQQAYAWLLENGPDGVVPANFMLIAGDSAGGTHTLALLAWIRDQGLRAPNGAIALSPATDLMHPSLRQPHNIKTDALLGPIVEKLVWMPTPLLWSAMVLMMRALPSNPVVSPLHGKLHNLAPTLIQVSDAELLRETVQLYAAKANNAGSSVVVQTFADMVHVWPIFSPPLPETKLAFAKMAEFIASLDPSLRGVKTLNTISINEHGLHD